MGANIIEDNSGDAAQQLIDNIREKGNRENCPKNLIVERDTQSQNVGNKQPNIHTFSSFSGLQQLSDIINSAAKKASDSKTQKRQRVPPPNIPGGKRVGPNIIEDDSEDAAQQLRDKIREKGKRDNRPENSSVERDKTY